MGTTYKQTLGPMQLEPRQWFSTAHYADLTNRSARTQHVPWFAAFAGSLEGITLGAVLIYYLIGYPLLVTMVTSWFNSLG